MKKDNLLKYKGIYVILQASFFIFIFILNFISLIYLYKFKIIRIILTLVLLFALIVFNNKINNFYRKKYGNKVFNEQIQYSGITLIIAFLIISIYSLI